MKPENKMIWKTLTADAARENLSTAADYAQRCKAMVDYLAGPHCVTENHTAELARRIMFDAYRKMLDIAPTK